MKQGLRILLSLLLLTTLLAHDLYSEGSKELYQTTYNTYLFTCNDPGGQCSSSGGSRTRFAAYDGPENDRLCFVVLNPSETVYMGFNGAMSYPNGTNSHIVFRIKDWTGTVVYAEANLPTSGTGFISNINQARTGPSQITVGGYTAINWHPATPGLYYIEWTRKLNSTGAVELGGITMDLFDITIYDTVASLVKPGRLYSKSWQLQEDNNCSAKTYIYSADSITTSCQFDDMNGGIWVQFCNQWGCQNTNNFVVDRKSRTTQSLLPQYKIFLNPPDVQIFPPATTLGQIIPPQPWGEQDCTTGHITFHVNVDKPGNVEIELTFMFPYVTRILNQTVVQGANTIIWDGLDGTLPTGVAVPNNVQVTFTVKYINGLTNLPFYDVEGNPNGFVIDIVAPPGSAPLVYWDDTNITGGGSNLTGCASPPGCHTWSNAGQGFGNLRTLNTWWYNVSASTTPINIPQWRKPGALTFNQSPPQSYCAGTTGVIFSVAPEINTEEYHWSYTGTGATIQHINPSDSYISVDFSPTATPGNIEVYGTNFNCTTYTGPTSSLPITIKPVPVVTAPYTSSICSGNTTNITLNSTPTGSLFNWVSPPPTCTPNIGSCPGGSINATTISDYLAVTDQNPGTVTYHISGTLNGCTGPVQDYVVTVNPFKTPVVNGPNSVCKGTTGNIYSVQSGMTNYAWSVSAGGIITAGSSTNTITVTWNTDGAQTVSVNYTDDNGCVNNTPTTYNVNVIPLPVPTIGGPASPCVNSSGNVYTTEAVMTNYVWTVSSGGTIISGSGTNSITVTWNSTGNQTVSVNYTNAVLCTGASATVYNVTVNARPTPTLNGPLTSCAQNQKTYKTESGKSNYIWTVSAGGTVVAGGGTAQDSVTVLWTTAGTRSVSVNYNNAAGCAALAATTLNITVYPTPDVTINGTTPTLCSGLPTNIQLSSSISGTTFAWTIATTGSVVGASAGNGNQIIQNLSNSGFTNATVTYKVIPTANGCSPGTSTDYLVTIYPVPDLSNNPKTKGLCKGESTNITLTSNVTGALFTWTCTPSSGNITGWSNNSTPTILLDQTLINTVLNVETVTYHIIPHANGCDGSSTNFVVSVFQEPVLTMNPFSKTICSETSTALNLTSSLAGTTYTWVATLGSGNITGFSNGTGSAINQTLTNNATTAGTVNYTISFAAGICAGNDTTYVVTVNPKPHLTNSPATSQICNNTSPNVTLLSDVTGTQFTWTASGSSGQVGGFSNNSTPTTLLNQTLTNSGFNLETVTYSIIPRANSCNGPAANYTVTVYPVADVYFSPASQAICPGQTTNITNNSHVLGSSYTWTAAGSSGNVSGYSNGNGALIQQTLDNTSYNNETVTYTVLPTANGCVGTSSNVVATVHPNPFTTFTNCFDPVVTTNAQPIKLKGGIPLSGTYSGPGVSGTTFTPATAGVGTHTIYYVYTNTYGCNASANTTITVISPASFTCGSNLVDPRDSQTYPTIQIGTQCWMSANLNYGASITSANMQRDNCITEKYCYNDNTAACTSSGGLYQWDELMKYDNTSGSQGLCPPTWHIPTETEWTTLFNFYISSGFAGSPLKNTGYSGFDADLDGVRFKNANWNFLSFATLFWSSNSHGIYKAWAHGMNTYNPSVSFYPGARSNAFSVRCLKD